MKRTRWFVPVAAAVAMLFVASPAGAVAPVPAVVGSPSGGDPYFPAAGNGGYDVAHYDLTLDYTPTTRALTGHRDDHRRHGHVDAVELQPRPARPDRLRR